MKQIKTRSKANFEAVNMLPSLSNLVPTAVQPTFPPSREAVEKLNELFFADGDNTDLEEWEEYNKRIEAAERAMKSFVDSYNKNPSSHIRKKVENNLLLYALKNADYERLLKDYDAMIA